MAPNIIEYTATAELTPSDRGIQAAEIAGRRIGLYGQELAQNVKSIGDAVENHMAVMEVSELYKTAPQLEYNVAKRYERESADLDANGNPDPNSHNRNDPHFGDRFMAEVGPLIDQWGQGATTERGKLLAATLKEQIRNNIFRRVAGGQAEMDWAHYQGNQTSLKNTLSAQLIDDPSIHSYEAAQGLWEQSVRDGTAHISDVAMREQAFAHDLAEGRTQLTLARYRGASLAIERQIEATGDPSRSPAKAQIDEDIAKRLGFEFLDPVQQQAVIKEQDDAVHRGQELFRSRDATAKAQTTEQGKAAYAEIHTAITALALKGQGPTPDLIDAIGRYSRAYGATNPGEVSSLDDYLVRAQDRGQENKVQPYNQQTRDNIQSYMFAPAGDPRRPTLASIGKAWSSGQITAPDLSMYTEIINKRDKPETDPTFKPAWENFVRWQGQMIQSIGNKGYPGTAAARAQFLHDSTANFMARGRNGGDWDKALDMVTNVKNPHNFAQALHFYQKAAQHSDAAGWLRENGLSFDPNGDVTKPAHGSTANPVYPTAHPNTPSQPTKIPQNDVDSIFGVPH